MTTGTVLVLIGAILFGIAALFTLNGEPRGPLFRVTFILALAGVLTAVGVLLGAPPIN